MVQSSLIPGKKLFQLRLQISASPLPGKTALKNWLKKERHWVLGRGPTQVAGVCQNPWGHETLLCSCKPTPWPAPAFLYSAKGHVSTLYFLLGHVLHLVLVYFHDYVMPVYLLARDRMLPKVRDGTFCLHNAVLWVLNVLQVPCCPDSGYRPPNVLLGSEEENGIKCGALWQTLTGFLI